MPQRRLIRGARIVDPATGRDEVGDLLIDGARVAERGASASGAEVIDAKGLVLMPGAIDVHVHLREPGREDEETIESGARAAIAGGFTAVACMPNTEPALDNQGAVRFVTAKAREAGLARVFPIGAITVGRAGERLTEIGEMVAAGAVAFSDDGDSVERAGLLRRAFEYARMFDVPLISHCEDKSLSAGGVMNDGAMSTRLGLRGWPCIAEEVIIARDIAIAEFTGGRLHVAHVSSAGGVELVRQGKRRGVRVTAESMPHYFTLTDEALAGYDTNYKVNPPIRTAADREAIIAGLADGTLDTIASDHAPHASFEKDLEFDRAPFGLVGLETTLGLVMTELVARGRLSLAAAVERMTAGPARALGLPLGTLAPGAMADVTLFDPAATWRVDAAAFETRSKNSPFVGRELSGRVAMVFVAGEVRLRDGQIVPGRGAGAFGDAAEARA
ncbi:MAG: dihydroorotase [bacterium]